VCFVFRHIRLKSARDPAHTEAVVNMTDETGRRNYSKYNKYLTMMKVRMVRVPWFSRHAIYF